MQSDDFIKLNERFFNKGFFENIKIRLEAVSKVKHDHIHNDLNQLDKQPMKLLLPLENDNFKKYMTKGGDIMLVDNDNKHVHVIELKNRTTPFPDNEIVAKKKIKDYAKDLVKDYPQNMLVAIECDNEAISTDLLNYINAYKDNEFCYARSDLKKPEVIAELKSLPLKPRFQQLFIINASDYHDPATPSDYAFEQLRIAELSQYTDDQKIKFIAMNELEVLECFENPSFKVNADLNETKIIYNNTFYARSSK